MISPSLRPQTSRVRSLLLVELKIIFKNYFLGGDSAETETEQSFRVWEEPEPVVSFNPAQSVLGSRWGGVLRGGPALGGHQDHGTPADAQQGVRAAGSGGGPAGPERPPGHGGHPGWVPATTVPQRHLSPGRP